MSITGPDSRVRPVGTNTSRRSFDYISLATIISGPLITSIAYFTLLLYYTIEWETLLVETVLETRIGSQEISARQKTALHIIVVARSRHNSHDDVE